ncbi:MAG TPA: polyketide synthase, partial [Longimicrobiaceae bacterium]|nr:polyketide synthase [Longimicrobiaceae bacterium]
MSQAQMPEPLEGIAIIGMAGRFPGARNVDEFWRNLEAGRETISFFSEEELLAAGATPGLLSNPDYVRARGVLDDMELFDAGFFSLTAAEAALMAPEHRLFLECAWEALESSGYTGAGRRVGVFGGASYNTYMLNNLLPGRGKVSGMDWFATFLANSPDHLTLRTAYKLDLRGPALTTQTSCSTSLVAVHYACQSLINGECDLALAGGAAGFVPRIAGYGYQEGGILSPDGHCRTFDADAGGTVPGSGAGVVVLKRLEDAVADRDTVVAVIRGSAVNNDGSAKIGYTAPSVDGQAAVIGEALAVADVDPETIGYVETHGTATLLGDPIEVAALTRAYRQLTDRKGFCAIGSVKSNVGHLD